MKRLIALSTLLFALNVSAECPSDITTEIPRMPDGSAASEETMRNAQVAMRTYVATIEAYLRCRDLELTTGSYNNLVDKAMAGADAYNRELRRYQRQDGMLAKN